jgi:hypothetical protein
MDTHHRGGRRHGQLLNDPGAPPSPRGVADALGLSPRFSGQQSGGSQRHPFLHHPHPRVLKQLRSKRWYQRKRLLLLPVLLLACAAAMFGLGVWHLTASKPAASSGQHAPPPTTQPLRGPAQARHNGMLQDVGVGVVPWASVAAQRRAALQQTRAAAAAAAASLTNQPPPPSVEEQAPQEQDVYMQRALAGPYPIQLKYPLLWSGALFSRSGACAPT